MTKAAAQPPGPPRTTGLWRADPEAQRREVVVGFGASTLVLSDGRSQRLDSQELGPETSSSQSVGIKGGESVVELVPLLA